MGAFQSAEDREADEREAMAYELYNRDQKNKISISEYRKLQSPNEAKKMLDDAMECSQEYKKNQKAYST